MPGLSAISSLISAVETVERNMMEGTYVGKAVKENAEEIASRNVEQLYNSGANSLGIRIDTYRPYTPYTVRIKDEKGQPTDRVTLRDTGAFHRAFEVVVEPTGFYITSSDSKTEGLIGKYGGRIFGLLPENKIEITRNFLYPSVMKQIHKELFS